LIFFSPATFSLGSQYDVTSQPPFAVIVNNSSPWYADGAAYESEVGATEATTAGGKYLS
tara:strand:+ start:195 stop:371 length:177 start_codon:yes stop_codon:yes gene_type:complete